jgi:hypothetical protein
VLLHCSDDPHGKGTAPISTPGLGSVNDHFPNLLAFPIHLPGFFQRSISPFFQFLDFPPNLEFSANKKELLAK